jgi:hypothetical protein
VGGGGGEARAVAPGSEARQHHRGAVRLDDGLGGRARGGVRVAGAHRGAEGPGRVAVEPRVGRVADQGGGPGVAQAEAGDRLERHRRIGAGLARRDAEPLRQAPLRLGGAGAHAGGAAAHLHARPAARREPEVLVEGGDAARGRRGQAGVPGHLAEVTVGDAAAALERGAEQRDGAAQGTAERALQRDQVPGHGGAHSREVKGSTP